MNLDHWIQVFLKKLKIGFVVIDFLVQSSLGGYHGDSREVFLYTKSGFMKSIELLSIADITQIFGVSQVSVYRWVGEARKGNSRFPLPIGDTKQKLRWLSSDIEAFCLSRSTARLPVISTSPKQQRQKGKSHQIRQEMVHQALERHGIKVNSTKKGEASYAS